MGIGVVHPEVAEAVAFVADEDGGGAGHCGVPVHLVCVWGCCDDVDVVGVEELEDVLVGGDGDGEVEDHAAGGADDVGVEDVDEGFADDEGVDTGGFCGADHVAEVAGFFDGFDDEEEGVVG